MAEVGFEMIFFSFGSGWNLEDTTPEFIDKLKSDIRYANSKGIEVGGYDLIALTRKVKDSWMATDNKGNVTNNACFASGWYDELLSRVSKQSLYVSINELGSFYALHKISCWLCGGRSRRSCQANRRTSIVQRRVANGSRFSEKALRS